MVNENAGFWTESQFRQIAAEYLGIQAYHILDDPETHGIQHIDCYGRPYRIVRVLHFRFHLLDTLKP